MNMPYRGRSLFVVVIAASLASTIGGLPFNSLPVMLGSMADWFAFDAKIVGWMGAACFTGYLVGTLGAPIWMNRLNWRWFTVLGAAGSAASLALSATVHQVNALYAVWALIGFFASTMTCLGMRVLSALPNKVRAYGVRQGMELSVTAAVLFVLPPLIIQRWNYPGAALALAAVVAVLGISAFWVPEHPGADEHVESAPTTKLPMEACLALFFFFLFLVGNIGLWVFLERIGASLKLAPAQTGLVFAVLKLLGGLAAFSVAIVGDRLGRNLPYILIAALIGLGLLLLANASSAVPFALGSWIWEYAFTCGCVFQVAAISRADASGRAVVLAPAMFALGSMVGPALAGNLVRGQNFHALLVFALISSLVPLIVTVLRSVFFSATNLERSSETA